MGVQQHMQRIPQVRHLVRRQHTPRLWLILVHSEHGRKICDRVGQGELLQYASLQEQVHADLWRMRVLVRRARDEHETSTSRVRSPSSDLRYTMHYPHMKSRAGGPRRMRLCRGALAHTCASRPDLHDPVASACIFYSLPSGLYINCESKTCG